MEDIVGPVHGFHLACYTVETPQGHYAYAKVCLKRPSCVWTAQAVRKIAAGPAADPAEAMAAVIVRSRRWLQLARVAVDGGMGTHTPGLLRRLVPRP